MTKDEQIERIIAQEIYCLANELGEHACKSETFIDDCQNLTIRFCVECGEEVPGYDDCPTCGADPDHEPVEIMQWYIVSDWLAEKFAAQGQTVGEHLGLHLWGRRECGSALTQDDCITQLATSIATE